ncbi:SEC14 cytosolic factor [Seminavis robusta]|uniref:SEC14 cytosolic factor n=1 Tax=Seminavis robusta TaxID=568900 RepID=A0A9N8EB12_9STRA|nr:SEC14 cytosolic factor [Seminavis robusta]|eukprot:Sro906_g218700.1 SEC14 cytosolic factor (351) ;mRNA; f:41641-42693
MIRLNSSLLLLCICAIGIPAEEASSPLAEVVLTHRDNALLIHGGGVSENDNKELSALVNTTSLTTTKPYHFSLYQPGDGSENDPDKIPKRFLSMQKGNRVAAKAALQATLQWRKEHDIGTILQRPRPNFDIYKSMLVHVFLGRDTAGKVVFLQRPALGSGVRLLELAEKNEIPLPEMVLEYAFMMEYLFNVLDPPTPDNNHDIRTLTTVIDMTGLTFSMLRHRNLLSFVKEFVVMQSVHYPQRAYKTLLVNAPSWFEKLYQFFTPMLRESTKAKIEILGRGSPERQKQVLTEVLGEDLLQYLPDDMLGSSDDEESQESTTVPVSPMEQELREFVLARLQEEGMEMNVLVE